MFLAVFSKGIGISFHNKLNAEEYF